MEPQAKGTTASVKDMAQRLLAVPLSADIDTIESARNLHFTVRQAHHLITLFGESMPQNAYQILQEYAVATTASRAFNAVAVAARQRPREGSSSKNAISADKHEEALEASIKAILDPAIESGACLDYELVEAVYQGHGVFIIKIGIYPWGMTFLDGTIKNIGDDIRHILREIRQNRITCPTCRASQPLDGLMTNGWRCVCKTTFFVRQGFIANAGITGEFCWPDLEQTLRSRCANQPALTIKAIQRIKDGADLDQVFSGAGAIDVFDSVVYWIAKDVAPIPDSDLPAPLLLAEALEALNFRQHVEETMFGSESTWFERTAHGERLLVVVENFEQHGECLTVVWLPGDKQLRGTTSMTDKEWIDSDDDTPLERWEVWSDSHPDQCQIGAWSIESWRPIGNDSYFAGATFNQAALPSFKSVFEARSWFIDALPEAISACQQVIQLFLQQDRVDHPDP